MTENSCRDDRQMNLTKTKCCQEQWKINFLIWILQRKDAPEILVQNDTLWIG